MLGNVWESGVLNFGAIGVGGTIIRVRSIAALALGLLRSKAKAAALSIEAVA